MPPKTVQARLHDSVVSLDLTDRAHLVDQIRQAVAAIEQHSIELTYEGKSYRYLASELGIRVSTEQAISHAVGYLYPEGWWARVQRGWQLRSQDSLDLPLQVELSEEKLADVFKDLALSLRREPVPATLTIKDRQPVITPEVNGRQLALARLGEAILRELGAGGKAVRIELPVEEVPPEVTKASLEAMKIRRLIGTATTAYDPKIPRAENVALAARSLNGLILKPGETLSYNKTVGPVTPETGYKDAYVIANGELVTGVGGGICQVSSTLYGAVLRADLKVEERHQHYLTISYLPPSLDAAVWEEGGQDFRFTNSTNGHIMLQTFAANGKVTIDIYGDAPEGREIELTSEVLKSIPFTDKVVIDPSLAPGEQRIKINGLNGFQSVGYKLVYENGKLVRREQLSVDNYAPSKRVILQGPPPAEQAPAPEPNPQSAPGTGN